MLIPSCLLTFAFTVTAPDLRGQEPFPFHVVSEASDRVELVPRPGLLERLIGRDRVSLLGVPLPGLESAEVHLEREPAPAVGNLFVNGEPARLAPARLSLWSGEVTGQPDSDVFLALSSHGSWGWMRVAGRTTFLESRPGPNGRWSDYRSRLVAAESAAPLAAFTCESPSWSEPPMVPVAGGPSVPGAGRGAAAPGRANGEEYPELPAPTPLLEARLGLETDWQYFQIFGDLEAARAYALAMIGAVNLRYREFLGALVTPIYLGFWTVPEDPWNGTDNNLGACAVLNEFRNKWSNGQAPVEADVYHLYSGSPRQGGCASIDTLCNQARAFGVTLSVQGNFTPPGTPSVGNYDFVILAHEIGHSFGAIHTHEHCPPIDECARPGSFGRCQDEQVCRSEGTLMSYCGQCPGGFANHNLRFHPRVAARTRARAERTCIRPFEGVLTLDLGHGLAGSRGVPDVSVVYRDGERDGLELLVEGAPPRTVGLMVGSLRAAFQSFGGGTLVPRPDLLVPVLTDASGSASATQPVIGRHQGLTLYAQGWFLDLGSEGGFAATPGVKIELFR